MPLLLTKGHPATKRIASVLSLIKVVRRCVRSPKDCVHLGVEFDLILSSPYVRARETAEIVADIFKMKKKIAFSENLIPMGDPELLIPEVNEKYSVDSIALVGHEPHLSTLVGVLTTENTKLDITLKKGGVCYLSTDDLHHEHRATLEWLLTPGILVEISDK